MLDIKRIRENPEGIQKAIQRRHTDVNISELLALDEKRRTLIYEVEQQKAYMNQENKKIGVYKKEGKDPQEVFAELKKVSTKIKEMDAQVSELDTAIKTFLLTIPNVPNADIPDGADDSENKEVFRYGTPRTFSFASKAHWDIGTDLDILDFERGAKISGARFTVYKGLGARLERSLVNFFLNTHTENGYTEAFPPYLVNRASMTGTGQLPKFENDAFKTYDESLFLIPTAEVPITNLHRDEVLSEADLPINYCAYSACFREEAGAAGRDTRGLIRQHQFNKVELVKFANPENSYEELEKLTAEAELILQKLELPYRKVCLCAGDIGFSSAKTYDLEVWMPSYNRYVEISSCSNFEDYQARRANIRFKKDVKDKPKFVHTLNGSGLAVGRTTAAILENYQNEDGTVTVPEVLRPYMGTDIIS